MQQDAGITAVAHAIQLAVAPVFLLSGVGAMLAVLTNRLSRIIDRSRVLETQLATSPPEVGAGMHTELQTLSRRAKLISHAITFCSITTPFVFAVISSMFVGALVRS